MEQIKQIMETQLTEKEIMIFLLVEDGTLSRKRLANILLTSDMTIGRIYDKAKEKLDSMSTIFSTPVEKSSK